MTTKAKYTIGTQYRKRNKRRDICTVTDIHRTYNEARELVKLRYVSTHVFMGQLVTEQDVVETSISMGLITNQ